MNFGPQGFEGVSVMGCHEARLYHKMTPCSFEFVCVNVIGLGDGGALVYLNGELDALLRCLF